MPATIKDTVDSAEKQWTFFGKSTWNLITGKKKIAHTDDEVKFAKFVIANYNSVGGGSPSVDDIANDDYAWSAVGMSAFMKLAGFVKAEFPFAQSHSVFIRHFIKAGRAKDKKAAFWGFRFGDAGGQPDVGDLVAYARGQDLTAKKAAAFFDKTGDYTSHSDLVVAKRAGEIDVIGANVLDSVTKKTLALDDAGHIDDSAHFWFATLKRKFGA
jgi:hypothetical protein